MTAQGFLLEGPFHQEGQELGIYATLALRGGERGSVSAWMCFERFVGHRWGTQPAKN